MPSQSLELHHVRRGLALDQTGCPLDSACMCLGVEEGGCELVGQCGSQVGGGARAMSKKVRNSSQGREMAPEVYKV